MLLNRIIAAHVHSLHPVSRVVSLKVKVLKNRALNQPMHILWNHTLIQNIAENKCFSCPEQRTKRNHKCETLCNSRNRVKSFGESFRSAGNPLPSQNRGSLILQKQRIISCNQRGSLKKVENIKIYFPVEYVASPTVGNGAVIMLK